MYKVNDTVLYNTYGVCKIVEILKKDFGGTDTECYALKPVFNSKSMVYIPINGRNALLKMHHILSAKQIYSLIKTMPDETTIWIEGENERKEYYEKILAGGNRSELVKLIKTLYNKSSSTKERKLHAIDRYFMKEAEKKLYEEFAYVLNIKLEEVLPFIFEQTQIEEKEKN